MDTHANLYLLLDTGLNTGLTHGVHKNSLFMTFHYLNQTFPPLVVLTYFQRVPIGSDKQIFKHKVVIMFLFID